MGAISRIESTIKKAGIKAEKRIRRQLNIVRVGNTRRMNTYGMLSKTIQNSFNDVNGRTTIVVTSAKYGRILDKGVDPLKVPYSVGTKAGESEYITGLALWAAKKFYRGDYKMGLKAAFRIAKTQKGIAEKSKYEGSPKAPGWIEEIIKDLDKELVEFLHNNIGIAIAKDAHRILNRTI